jgi:hypothetical protein
LRDLLTEATGFATLLRRDDPSPWTGAALHNGELVQRAMDLAARLAGQDLPAFMASLHLLLKATGLRAPVST